MTEPKRGPGRPKGSKNKPKLDVIQGGVSKLKGAGTVGPGHNQSPELTDDQRKALFLSHLAAYERVLTRKDEIVADLRNIAKKAKADGIPKADLDEAIRLKKAEAEEIAEKQRRRAEIANWLGLGVQLDFFDHGPDRKPVDEKAEEAGFEAGARGDAPETSLTGDLHQSFMAGYHRGVAARNEAKARITGEELAVVDPMIDRTFAERAAAPAAEAPPEAPSTTETLADGAPPPWVEEAEEAFSEAIEDAEG